MPLIGTTRSFEYRDVANEMDKAGIFAFHF